MLSTGTRDEVKEAGAGSDGPGTSPSAEIDPQTRAFYCETVEMLNGAGVDYLVGGAYALARYTGIVRHTKDFDIFVRREDCPGILEFLAGHGYRTETTFPHWLAKAFREDGSDDFIDIIYGSGNGVALVDEEWFEHAAAGEVLGCAVRLCPAEEIIWSKSFVQERERFDGADIIHLLRASGPELDWHRLLRRFGEHWRVLFGHLVLYGFAYPAERGKVPAWVSEELAGRLLAEARGEPAEGRVCRGTLLSREQYLVDIRNWNYEDARLTEGHMKPEDVAHWTDAIGKIK